jgi:hypothetical protein
MGFVYKNQKRVAFLTQSEKNTATKTNYIFNPITYKSFFYSKNIGGGKVHF